MALKRSLVAPCSPSLGGACYSLFENDVPEAPLMNDNPEHWWGMQWSAGISPMTPRGFRLLPGGAAEEGAGLGPGRVACPCGAFAAC